MIEPALLTEFLLHPRYCMRYRRYTFSAFSTYLIRAVSVQLSAISFGERKILLNPPFERRKEEKEGFACSERNDAPGESR